MRLELVENDRVVKEYIKGFEVKCEKCGRVVKTVLYKNPQPIFEENLVQSDWNESISTLPSFSCEGCWRYEDAWINFDYDRFDTSINKSINTMNMPEASTFPLFVKEAYIAHRDKRKKKKAILKTETAVCEECMKKEPYLVVDENFGFLRWLRTDRIVEEEEIFVKVITAEFLRENTPDAYAKVETREYKHRRNAKQAINNYTEETSEYWRKYLVRMSQNIVKSNITAYKNFSNDVLEFANNNDKNVYIEVFEKNIFDKQNTTNEICATYQFIDTNPEKVEKIIKEKERDAKEAADNCINWIYNEDFKREIANLIKCKVIDELMRVKEETNEGR